MGQVLITHLLTWFRSCVVTWRKFLQQCYHIWSWLDEYSMCFPLENIFVLIQRKMYLAISLTVKIVPSDMWHVTIYLFFMHLEPHTSNECIFNRFDIEIRAHDFYPLKMILYLKNVLCPYHLYCDIMKRKNSYNILVDHTCAF